MPLKKIFIIANCFIALSTSAQINLPSRKSLEKKIDNKQNKNENEASNNSRESKEKSRGDAITALKYIDSLIKYPFILKRGNINIGGDNADNEAFINAALEASDAVIKEHENKVDEFLKTAPNSTFTNNGKKTAEIKSKFVLNAITKAEEEYKTARSMANVYYMQEIYLYQAYIAGAMKIYPEITSLKEYYDAATAAIQKLGSRKAYVAKIKSNYKDWVKNLRLKPSMMTDAAIEQLVKTSFPKEFPQEKMTVTKVHITTVWMIEKNVLDIPLHKEIEVNLAIKKADGSCGLAAAYVRKVYEGGGNYGEAYLMMPSAITIVPCENIQ